MESFGIKDVLDILLVATLLFYLYKLMKESGTINIFYGVMAFIVVWFITSVLFEMRLMGTILNNFMNIGLLVLVIIFQDQIKQFLDELGSQKKWHFIKNLFKHHKTRDETHSRRWVMPIVYACMNMARNKTGALIVIEQGISLETYKKTGDVIDADINSRLIENIFFKNSPLHDGAMIVAKGRIKAAGCILPVSHDANVPRTLGLRHRAALGIAQATDAFAIVVSEETGNISIAHHGELFVNLDSTELEHRLSQIM